MLKQPKLEPRRCGLCAMINAPLSQSLTSTRATPPAWYTSSQIESSPLHSCLWCNRTWLHRSSQDTYPLFISSNKVLCVSWLQQQLLKCVRRFWGQHGYSSALSPAEDVMIKVCVPQAKHNLQHPQVPLPVTLHGAKLIIVQTNYMTRWEKYDCRSVPVVCQINKCLMTLSLPLFNLIRGGADLLDGWLYSNRLWIWSRGLPALHSLCVLVCSAAAWLLP